jgi:hypothetical protein
MLKSADALISVFNTEDFFETYIQLSIQSNMFTRAVYAVGLKYPTAVKLSMVSTSDLRVLLACDRALGLNNVSIFETELLKRKMLDSDLVWDTAGQTEPSYGLHFEGFESDFIRAFVELGISGVESHLVQLQLREDCWWAEKAVERGVSFEVISEHLSHRSQLISDHFRNKQFALLRYWKLTKNSSSFVPTVLDFLLAVSNREKLNHETISLLSERSKDSVDNLTKLSRLPEFKIFAESICLKFENLKSNYSARLLKARSASPVELDYGAIFKLWNDACASSLREPLPKQEEVHMFVLLVN